MRPLSSAHCSRGRGRGHPTDGRAPLHPNGGRVAADRPTGGADSRRAADDAAGDRPPACRRIDTSRHGGHANGTDHHASRRQQALRRARRGRRSTRSTSTSRPGGSPRSWVRRAAASRRSSTSSAPSTGRRRARSSMDGVRVDRLSETAAARFRRAKVGFVFQFFHLLEDLTVRENVAVAARSSPAGSRAEADARADEMLAQLGLADHGRQLPGDPQRRRAAAARDRPGRRSTTRPSCSPTSRRARSTVATARRRWRSSRT